MEQDVIRKIKEALNEIRPSLKADGGDVEFIGFDNNTGIVSVKLQGACQHCQMSTMTLKMGIEKALKEKIEEVKSVISI